MGVSGPSSCSGPVLPPAIGVSIRSLTLPRSVVRSSAKASLTQATSGSMFSAIKSPLNQLFFGYHKLGMEIIDCLFGIIQRIFSN